MKTTSKNLWPHRIFIVCGTVISVFIFGDVLTGVVIEAPQMWREGSAAFFAYTGRRLGGGAFFAILSAIPYVLLARAARQPGMQNFFGTIGALTFAIQLGLMINALFFGRISTASVGVAFISVCLCIPIAATWGVASLALNRRGPR